MTDLQIKAATLAEQERANKAKEALEGRKVGVTEAVERREKATYPARFISEMLQSGFGMYKDTSTGAANLGKLIQSLAGSIH